MKLNYSPVQFTSNPHSYHLGDREYSGITSILKKYLFADMYNGIPESTIEIARNRGSLVHAQIENVIIGMPNEDERPEVAFYRKLGIEAIESEYTVSSDRFGVASNIDIVAKGQLPNGVRLKDIKTTSVLHKDYLAWQLSIYAYLFEKQNPDVVVEGLDAVHLKVDGGREVPITRLPDMYVEALLTAFLRGDEKFDNPMNTSAELMLSGNDEVIAKAVQLEEAILSFKKKKEEAESELDELKVGLMNIMASAFPDGGTYTFPNGTKLTYKPQTESLRFSQTDFKAAEPELYAKYMRKGITSASLSIRKVTIKDPA